MTKISISFSVHNKTVNVERELKTEEDLKEVIEKLLIEIEDIGVKGKTTSGQFRALYAKALDYGWSKDKIREFLEAKLDTSEENEIVGKVDRLEFSRLIDEVGGGIESPGKATVSQMSAMWGKALDKGWTRVRVKEFLKSKLGTNKEEEIVGIIDKYKLSNVIDELENL
ncbi:MAG: hypothetical protein APR63_06640 [Desulfuromonas sp. SDB]|nr:MAG: hypothetical protein APR63_06640 [Desulfuromonas sp. SDB]